MLVAWFGSSTLAQQQQQNRPATTPHATETPLLWGQLPALPDPIGYGGPFVGTHGEALLVAGGAERLDRRSKGPGEAVSSALPDWLDLRPEARNYLLLVVRREREVTRTTADAANLLNKAEVVESYQVHGNRWTMRPDGRERHPALKKAMALEPASEAASTAEWLNHLGNAIEAPQLGRPWYRSTFVLLILAFAVLFVLVHLLLLARALSKVHASDPALLLLPVKAFGGAAAVGLFAVSIHKLSGGGGAS